MLVIILLLCKIHTNNMNKIATIWTFVTSQRVGFLLQSMRLQTASGQKSGLNRLLRNMLWLNLSQVPRMTLNGNSALSYLFCTHPSHKYFVSM